MHDLMKQKGEMDQKDMNQLRNVAVNKLFFSVVVVNLHLLQIALNEVTFK